MEEIEILVVHLTYAFTDIKNKRPGGLMKAKAIFEKLKELRGTSQAALVYWSTWDNVMTKLPPPPSDDIQSIINHMYDALTDAFAAWEHPYHEFHVKWNIKRSQTIRDALGKIIGKEKAENLWQQKYQYLLSMSGRGDKIQQDR